MGRAMRKLFTFAAGTAAAWALAIKPRTSGKPDMSEMKKYDFADRGYFNLRKKIPENSLPAFQAAVEHGYGIVMDVRLSRDGVPMIFRDSRLWRVCGEEGTVEGTSSEKLKECRLSGTDETIPTLEEALKLADAQVPVLLKLNVELDNYGTLCARVCEALDAYDGVFAVESFDYRAVKWFRDHRPEYIRGQMMERHAKHGGTDLNPVQDFVRFNLLTNFLASPDFISCNLADRRTVSLLFCRLLYRVQTMDWTVRSMEDYELVKTDESIVVFEDIEP
jgi:glycerophosphoryl diester phosphodiesterase